MPESNPIVLTSGQREIYQQTAQAMSLMRANHLFALHSIDLFAQDTAAFLAKPGRPPAVQALLEAQSQQLLLSYTDELGKLLAEQNKSIMQDALHPPNVVVRDVTPQRSKWSDRPINQFGRPVWYLHEKLLAAVAWLLIVVGVNYWLASVLLLEILGLCLMVPIVIVSLIVVGYGWSWIYER